MKDLWVKFGCFLIGYNYSIVRISSEATAKAVKKYLAAMLIIITLWGFIGFSFTQRYLHGNTFASILGGLLMMIIVTQIERQVILSVGKSKWALGFRVLIGLVMAVIGSLILDQVIFKDDVEKHKIADVQKNVNNILPIKTLDLKRQIGELNQAIDAKETERINVLNEISRRPTIASITTSSQKVKNDETGQLDIVSTQVNSNSIPNPKAELIPKIDEQLRTLREQKTKREDEILNSRQLLERNFNANVGFLDELEILFNILYDSRVALVVWLLIFLFFFSLELFVILIKTGDNKNDYDSVVEHQMKIRMAMINKLGEKDSIVDAIKQK
jgi:hypothetical protein